MAIRLGGLWGQLRENFQREHKDSESWKKFHISHQRGGTRRKRRILRRGSNRKVKRKRKTRRKRKRMRYYRGGLVGEIYQVKEETEVKANGDNITLPAGTLVERRVEQMMQIPNKAGATVLYTVKVLENQKEISDALIYANPAGSSIYAGRTFLINARKLNFVTDAIRGERARARVRDAVRRKQAAVLDEWTKCKSIQADKELRAVFSNRSYTLYRKKCAEENKREGGEGSDNRVWNAKRNFKVSFILDTAQEERRIDKKKSG